MATYNLAMYGLQVDVELPASWKVNYLPMKPLPAISKNEMRAAFDKPIGTAPISTLAKGKKSAVIIVEDTTRVCPTDNILPMIVADLQQGGITKDNIKFVMGVGGHRPMSGRQFREKLGDDIVNNFRVINPNPYENMVEVGTTARGTPVEVDMAVVEADLKISVGALLPHNQAGFTGGGKLILPGVCSMRTITAHHFNSSNVQGGFGDVGCTFRDEIEAAARVAGLDVIVEAVINSDLEVAGLFVGDLVEAHRAGSRMGEKVYPVKGPKDADIVIITGYPRDMELQQAMALFSPHTGAHSVRKEGAILMLASAREGNGYHTLRDRTRKTWKQMPPISKHTLLHVPLLAQWEADMTAPAGTVLYTKLEEAVAELERLFPGSPTVNVFPHGCMTIFCPRQ